LPTQTKPGLSTEKMPILKAHNLTKKFNRFTAVGGISFTIDQGEIFGLLGPNGAGKTTTIRMLTGVIQPTAGEIEIGGYNLQKEPIAAKQLMGIVPEVANAYLDLAAYTNLLFVGELYGLKNSEKISKAKTLLELFGLAEFAGNKVKTFSKGMKQRLILAMALMNNSKILFLDEPTSGLDVKSTRVIRRVIRQLNQEGKTILLTTHNIDEANQLCGRIAIMNYGKIVVVDSPEKLKNAFTETTAIEVSYGKAINQKDFKRDYIDRVEKYGDKFRFYTQDVSATIQLLVDYSKASKNKIISLNTIKPSLEDIFLKFIEREND